MHSDSDPSLNRRIGEALRALPRESPSPFGWEELRRRARAQGRLRGPGDTLAVSGRHSRMPGARLAIAASLAFILLSAARLVYWLGGPGAPGPVADEASQALRPSVPSAQLDASRRWLASLPDDRAIVRVGSRAAVLDLEDRLALMDDTLNAARISGLRPARLQALQNERAQLLQSLVQVRYAETLAAESP